MIRDPDVYVLYPEGPGRLAHIDEAEVERRYGVPGRAYMDFAVLRGDPSDGLPGVPGIGPKKAAALIARYGNLDAIIDQASLGPPIVDYLHRARKVVQPVATIPLPEIDCTLPRQVARADKLAELCDRYHLKSPLERLLGALRQG